MRPSGKRWCCRMRSVVPVLAMPFCVTQHSPNSLVPLNWDSCCTRSSSRPASPDSSVLNSTRYLRQPGLSTSRTGWASTHASVALLPRSTRLVRAHLASKMCSGQAHAGKATTPRGKMGSVLLVACTVVAARLGPAGCTDAPSHTTWAVSCLPVRAAQRPACCLAAGRAGALAGLKPARAGGATGAGHRWLWASAMSPELAARPRADPDPGLRWQAAERTRPSARTGGCPGDARSIARRCVHRAVGSIPGLGLQAAGAREHAARRQNAGREAACLRTAGPAGAINVQAVYRSAAAARVERLSSPEQAAGPGPSLLSHRSAPQASAEPRPRG